MGTKEKVHLKDSRRKFLLGSLQLSRRCAEAPLSKTSKKTLSCLDPDCGNDSLNFPNLGFFALPKDPVIRRRWGKAIPLNWRKRFRSKDQSIRLCAVHFDPRDFVDPEEKKELKLTAVPSWKQPEESRPQLNSTIHGDPPIRFFQWSMLSNLEVNLSVFGTVI